MKEGGPERLGGGRENVEKGRGRENGLGWDCRYLDLVGGKSSFFTDEFWRLRPCGAWGS